MIVNYIFPSSSFFDAASRPLDSARGHLVLRSLKCLFSVASSYDRAVQPLVVILLG